MINPQKADPEHPRILKQGVIAFNAWRKENPDIRPNLIKVYLIGADLSGANLSEANLRGADLSGADLSGANLCVATLCEANLSGADLSGANLSEANLSRANLSGADLSGANLCVANLCEANLSGANLSGADLFGTILGETNLFENDIKGDSLPDCAIDNNKALECRNEITVDHGTPYADKIQKEVEWHEVLREELYRLPIGNVVFNPPETMKLGVKERVETRISRDINANLMASLKGRGLPQIEELRISELMKVRLSGDDFDIVPLNEKEQIIEPTGFTEWAWDVTPRKSGKKKVHLHVTLRIRLPFGEERKDHPVLEREIVVQVNPVYSVKSFTVAYWKWIVTAMILPLIGWVWKTYIR